MTEIIVNIEWRRLWIEIDHPAIWEFKFRLSKKRNLWLIWAPNIFQARPSKQKFYDEGDVLQYTEYKWLWWTIV